MTINTTQAAAILKVTGSTVANLIKVGKLKDLSTSTTKRHEFMLDSKEVRAFKKIYKKRSHYKNIPAIPDKEVRINQVRNREVIKYPEIVEPRGMMTQIFNRLGNLETQVAILIKMWS